MIYVISIKIMDQQQNDKYQNTKIYYLQDDSTGEKLYFGSTYKTLDDRLDRHKIDSFRESQSEYNSKKSKYLRSMDLKNLSIHLIEDYPCNTRNEKIKRERYWFDIYKLKLNSYKPYITHHNRDSKNEKKRQVIKCKCGYTFTYSGKSIHMKSALHQDAMKLCKLD